MSMDLPRTDALLRRYPNFGLTVRRVIRVFGGRLEQELADTQADLAAVRVAGDAWRRESDYQRGVIRQACNDILEAARTAPTMAELGIQLAHVVASLESVLPKPSCSLVGIQPDQNT